MDCKCDHKASYRINADGQRIWCCEDHLQEELNMRVTYQILPRE